TSGAQHACDSRVAGPGSATVAATLRTHRRAPGSTITRNLMPSPAIAAAAALDARRPTRARDDDDLGVHQTLTRSCSRTQASTGRAVGSSVSEINVKGRFCLTAAASRRITSRSAPTSGARSVLLTTSRSEYVTPGPPLRGTLSPPATSMTKICTSTSPDENVAVRLSPPD